MCSYRSNTKFLFELRIYLKFVLCIFLQSLYKYLEIETYSEGIAFQNVIFEISTASNGLTHCSLVTPYGDMDLGRHWLR